MRHIIAPVVAISSIYGSTASAKLNVNEANIKAAVIFNLVRFSRWNDSNVIAQNDNIMLCTQTTPLLQEALGGLEGKILKGKTLIVKHLETPVGSFKPCNILFLSNELGIDSINYASLHDKHILTIGDAPEMLGAGIAMSVYRQGKKIRFSINKDTMHSAGITPSSKILNLAVEPR